MLLVGLTAVTRLAAATAAAVVVLRTGPAATGVAAGVRPGKLGVMLIKAELAADVCWQPTVHTRACVLVIGAVLGAVLEGPTQANTVLGRGAAHQDHSAARLGVDTGVGCARPAARPLTITGCARGQTWWKGHEGPALPARRECKVVGPV